MEGNIPFTIAKGEEGGGKGGGKREYINVTRNVQNLYEENYKTLLKDYKSSLKQMEIYTIFLNKKAKY